MKGWKYVLVEVVSVPAYSNSIHWWELMLMSVDLTTYDHSFQYIGSLSFSSQRPYTFLDFLACDKATLAIHYSRDTPYMDDSGISSSLNIVSLI